jgi:hypothetical protein
MKHNVVHTGKRNRAPLWLGALCLIFYFTIPGAISVFAQQESASLRQPQEAIPDSSTPPPPAYTAMTKRERWQDYEHTNFASYGAFFQAFFTGLGDFTGDVPHWDSGMKGLSEHVASEFGTFTIAGTIHSSLAAALHEDTRYFHCSCRGGFHRTLHALERTFLTYGDNGRLYPDISGLAGIYGGSMLTTEWYPAKYTATGYGVRQANIAVGVTSAIYVIREFSPEIKHTFYRPKNKGPER